MRAWSLLHQTEIHKRIDCESSASSSAQGASHRASRARIVLGIKQGVAWIISHALAYLFCCARYSFGVFDALDQLGGQMVYVSGDDKVIAPGRCTLYLHVVKTWHDVPHER